MTLWYIPIIATTFHTAISHVLPINPSSPNPSLHIPTSSPLHISIFSDLHFGEAQSTAWGPIQDTHTQTVITSILSHEHPHLAVLNGDLITGEDTSLHNSSRYLDRIVQPFVQRGVPWASTYGNHDSDVQLSRNAIFERERKYRLSLTRKMIDDVPSAGVTNYFIPVYQDRGGSEEQTPIMLLWFFDSRGGKAFQRTDPSTGEGIELSNWVDSSVVDWFVRTRTHLRRRYRRVVPSVAFVHIPVTAMLAFQDEGVDPNKEPGINDDVPLAAQGVGDGRDGSGGYASQDRPFLEALLGTEGLMAVFSGHDHGNSWCQKWNSTIPDTNITGNGLNLCFGQHSGYGGYGTWPRGSRQLSFHSESKTLHTWIRLENGTVSGRVTLNETYGEDVYSIV